MADVILLCWEYPGAPELNLAKIVRFLGGSVQLVKLTADLAGQPESLKRLFQRAGCLMTSAETLARLGGENKRGAGWRPLLASLAANILVYGFGPKQSHGPVLRDLSADSLGGVETLPARGCRINVSRDFRAVCRQFSGLSFDAVGPETQLVFVEKEGQRDCPPILSLNRRAFLARSNARHCQLLLLAGDQIADLDAAVPEGKSVLEFFSSLVPVLMFLRGSSSAGFWHNDRPSACFIVDDPLLKRRYGFLDYQKLLELMDRKRFSTSIAFIPWNHRRSHQRVAQLLASHAGAYSMCVHGCDHTRAEFGATDRATLREKAQQALAWMNSHRESSGVGFDDVMVFPQGIFSTAAMSALQSCGYLAAVNSTAYPVDANEALTLGDLLQVAVTRFSNFPLFTRRYPQRTAELAFDLFLGKPALVVEHHGFFRDGYEALAETVERLRGMDHRLEWGNLGTICSRACLERVASNGEAQVLFFTNRFAFRNETDQPKKYVLIRRNSAGDGNPVVAVNSRPVDVRHDGEGLKIELTLVPGQGADIRIESGQAEPMALPGRRDRLYQAKVFIRRSLSEFRDNYLDLNPFVSRAARNRQ